MKKPTKSALRSPRTVRHHRVVVSFSDEELAAIDAFCKKYRAKSRTSVVRSAALRAAMGQLMTDYPTLF